jgi:hypothetical protein
MKCTDCHNRGTLTGWPDQTGRESCVKCRVEKRGPYVFEHPAESRGLRHLPHPRLRIACCWCGAGAGNSVCGVTAFHGARRALDAWVSRRAAVRPGIT